MAGFSNALDRLSEAFGRLPGIGAKSAERLAHHILKSIDKEALALAEAIREAKEKVRHSRECFHLTEAASRRSKTWDPNSLRSTPWKLEYARARFWR